MRTSVSVLIAAFCGMSIIAQPFFVQPLFAQESEELIPLDEELPQVTITRRGDDTITEFRLRGKLYMVQVTAPNGMSYYLVDRDGRGQWIRDDNAPKLIAPTWVLTSW